MSKLATHFQSIFRRDGSVFCEPLCEQELFDGIDLSPRRAEVTCPECLGFLMRVACLKQSKE